MKRPEIPFPQGNSNVLGKVRWKCPSVPTNTMSERPQRDRSITYRTFPRKFRKLFEYFPGLPKGNYLRGSKTPVGWRVVRVASPLCGIPAAFPLIPAARAAFLFPDPLTAQQSKRVRRLENVRKTFPNAFPNAFKKGAGIFP